MRAWAAVFSSILGTAGCQPPPVESPPPAVVVLLPAGVSPKPLAADDRPSIPGLDWAPISRSVEMARTETTVGQYRACVDAGVCSDKLVHGIDWPGRVAFEPRAACTWPQHDDRLPINCVSYADAQAFCAFAGGRLPTADEWLFAASNGRTSRWPWGDERGPDCERAVLGMSEPGCSAANPKPVCSRPRGDNNEGICDLVGNVYEWTARPTRAGDPWVMAGECFNNFVPSRSLDAMTLTVEDERYRTPPLGIRCVRDRD